MAAISAHETPDPGATLSALSPSLFWLALAAFYVIIVAIAYSLGARLALVCSASRMCTPLGSNSVGRNPHFPRSDTSCSGAPMRSIHSSSGSGPVQRRWFLLAAGIAGQLLLFSLTGIKETLFSPKSHRIALSIFALSHKRSARLGRSLTLFMLILVALAALLSHFGQTSLMFLFVRRTMGTPGLLAAYYFDFFSTHAPTLFSHNILKFVLKNPYPEGPPFLIGRIYFNNPETSANASLFADGFAGLRYLGVLVEAGLTSVFLRLLDEAASGRDFRSLAAPLGLTGLGLVETGISTALLTDGLLLTFLLILVYCPGNPIRRCVPDVEGGSPGQLVEGVTLLKSPRVVAHE